MAKDRKALREALAARATAEKSVGTAKKVAAKASEYERGIEAEARELRVKLEAAKCAHADSIVDALRRGKAPVAEPEFGDIGIRLADAEGRLAAAKMAVSAVEGDVRDALADLDAAREKVLDEIRLGMIAEAEAMADAIERHEAEAIKLRARLGLDVGPIGSLRPLPDRIGKVIAATDMTTNSGPWFEMQKAVPRWGLFAEALGNNPEAELAFE